MDIKKNAIVSLMNICSHFANLSIENDKIKIERTKNKFDKSERTGVVYFFVTPDDILKVGQTSRDLSSRLSQYRNHYGKDQTSIKCEKYLKENDLKFLKVYFHQYKPIQMKKYNIISRNFISTDIDVTKSIEKDISKSLYEIGFNLPLQNNFN